MDRDGSGDRAAAISAVLRSAVAAVAPDGVPVTLLFSGGLDSSLLAWWLAPRPGLRLATVGVPGSADLARAERAAPSIGRPLDRLLVPPEEVPRRWAQFVAGSTDGSDPPSSVLFAFEIAFGHLPGRTVVVGQGADELFGGYARYDGVAPADAAGLARRDLDRLLRQDWPRTVARARAHRIDLVAPFLHPAVRAAVTALAPGDRFDPRERKGLLRRIARAAGLPESMAGAPKQAIQYGSGLARRLPRAPSRPGRDGAAPS